MPVGGERPVPVDFRLISATNEDLDRQVANGAFRADLLARLGGVEIHLPALRERVEDLGIIIAHHLRRLTRRGDRLPRFGARAARAIFRYQWLHNIRELEEALCGAVTLARGGCIRLRHLPAPLAEFGDAAPSASVASAELSVEHRARCAEILAAIRAARGNVTEAADSLGLSRNAIYRWINRCGIDPAAFRRDDARNDEDSSR